MTDLNGKVVLVTGASSGIGEATALLLAKHGAKVALAARRKDKLDDLVEQINKDGGEAMSVEADITTKEVCQQLVKQVQDAWGSVDILINNAGVMLLGSAIDAPLEEWEQMVALNIMGLLYMTHATLPIMQQQGSGHIVNISSVAGRTNNPTSAVYNLTKWGVGAFTESLRQELVASKTGIRTTLIEPGAVATELISHNRPEVQDMLKNRFGDMKRLESEDIAAGILYAVSQPQHVSINEVLIRPTEQPS
jgi:NADP-dependent 3-hydroxy acid dehydrogenase YdfG